MIAFLITLAVVVIAAYIVQMIFEYTNHTPIRFRIVLVYSRDPNCKSYYRLLYKHWPWSFGWNDVAALNDDVPYLFTQFSTIRRAEQCILKIMLEQKRAPKPLIVEEIKGKDALKTIR